MRPFIAVLLFALLSGLPPLSAQDWQTEDSRSLGDIAREAREQKRLKPPVTSARTRELRELIADMSTNDPEEYLGQITDLLNRQDFEGIERAAETARSRKSRFPGGGWKLYTFYLAIGEPSGGRRASEADWTAHLALLKKWVLEQPQSSTARIALAHTYLRYGSKARGTGYADTVTEEGWQLHGERAELALATLNEAAALPTRCPYWYVAMTQVALAQGWSKPRARALLDEAISFEPSFYYIYREYANYLQPKWYGTAGEAEAFAESTYRLIGGEEGAFIYFEIATLLSCNPCGDTTSLRTLSWPKIKEGYDAMERLYGTSNLKMNRFAFMAFNVGDKPAASETFVRIGDSWDQSVWRKRESFEAAKLWAAR